MTTETNKANSYQRTVAPDDELLENIARLKGQPVQKAVPRPVSVLYPVSAAEERKKQAGALKRKRKAGKIVEETIAEVIAEQGSTPDKRRKEADAWAQKKAGILAKAFNQSGALFEGLEALKDRPHSKFTYEVSEGDKGFYVSTNVSVYFYSYSSLSHGYLTLTFDQASGETTANLGRREKKGSWGSTPVELQSANGDVTEILKAITRRAAEQRLVI